LRANAQRDAAPEPASEALRAAALVLGRFTPRICLDPPDALALEVSGSLRLFGGEAALQAEIEEALTEAGFEPQMAAATTAQAALWRAAAGGVQLEAVPVEALGLDAEAVLLAHRLGVHTLGGLLRLPRDGLGRRFGQDLLLRLDRALGRLPEQRAFFVPPPRFSAVACLPAPVEHAARTLFVLQRLLVQMEGFLVMRQAGTREVQIQFAHEGRSPSVLTQRFAAPLRGVSEIASLLRERLCSLSFPAPVIAVQLADGGIEPLPPPQHDLFSARQARREPWMLLVERLRARLGDAAVYALALHADHRPEQAWRPASVPAGLSSDPQPQDRRQPSSGLCGGVRTPSEPLRPLWLLERPRPLREGGLALLAGPERIESGWWDGAEVRRDYFVARLRSGALAWVYRDERGWFLHGLFA